MLKYEQLLRSTHTAGAELSLALRRVQDSAGLSPIAAHQVFAQLDQAQAQISAAVGTVARHHALVRAVAEKAQIDLTAFGPVTDPLEAPDQFPTGELAA